MFGVDIAPLTNEVIKLNQQLKEVIDLLKHNNLLLTKIIKEKQTKND